MVENYTVEGADIKRTYLCGSPEVAAKRFLNYLRLYREERPRTLEITRKDQQFKAEVEWYFGKLEESSFAGAEGEWWRLLKVTKSLERKKDVVLTLLEKASRELA